MNILILNGSPRQGNCITAIKALTEGISQEHDYEVIDTYKLDISPCMACDACGCHNGCIADDDSNFIVNRMVEADMIIFVSPVYWWGITAQMKLVIDKAYCRGALLTGKKIGVIIIGGADTDSEQYSLIRGQFSCISRYLGWDILFHKDYSASAVDDLSRNTEALAELREEAENLQA